MTREEDLVRAILDVDWTTEPLHERDCPACDIAAELAGTWACAWDTQDTWYRTPVADGLPGDTRLDQATRIAAWVLHRQLLGFRADLGILRRQSHRRTESRSAPDEDA